MRSIPLHKISLMMASLVCLSYWVWLFFGSTMQVVHDAVEYENVGRLIYKQGWIGFFQNGVRREPLYSTLIAFSMWASDQLGTNYQTLQKILQLGLLFITQLLSWLILTVLEVRLPMRILTVLYIGFSPALVNASLSLYSEIALFPWIVLAVLLCAHSWNVVLLGNKRDAVLFAIATAAAFLACVFVKGIFLLVIYVLMVPFVGLAISAVLNNKTDVMGRAVVYVFLTVLCFQVPIEVYSGMHHRFSGRYEFANRAYDHLYGSAHKRVEPLTRNRLLGQITAIPGTGVCERFFSEEECKWTEFHSVDVYRSALGDMVKGLPVEQHKMVILEATKNKIIGHPLQYLMFTLIEAPRMLFWESTQIGFVDYPEPLHTLFQRGWFKDGVRFTVSLASITAVFGNLLYLWTQCRPAVWIEISEDAKRYRLLFFLLLMVFAYSGVYSLFAILTRFALPLGSIYLMLIAVMINRTLGVRGNSLLA